jgi:aryl-alcohol dehydrogenase-like predicted oxidoreductase
VGEYGHDDAVRLLRRRTTSASPHFDTADVYGDGYGETILKDALADRRSRCVYASKVDMTGTTTGAVRPARASQNWSPTFIRSAVEQSLARLGTDYIDWLQLHCASTPST